MSDPQTRILLIRHGLNDYVKEHRLAGRTPGVHLNAEGLAQAAALAERLGSAALAAIYSSPLERACETAAPVAGRHGLTVQPLDGVLETDCGAWTGQSLDELSKDDLWRQVQGCPSIFRFPGGESFVGDSGPRGGCGGKRAAGASGADRRRFFARRPDQAGRGLLPRHAAGPVSADRGRTRVDHRAGVRAVPAAAGAPERLRPHYVTA